MIHPHTTTTEFTTRPRRRRWRRAFTLVELMISIALVLILMIGINKVFKLTTDTVSIGTAISSSVRDSRAAQATFSDDIGNLATDSPFILIRSMVTPAFRNRADEQADRDYDPTATIAQRQAAMYSIDVNNNNKEGEGPLIAPGEIIRPTDLDNRNHRTDVLSFFTRGLHRRVTGNAGIYAADMSANESMVWYGHLWLPNNWSPPTANEADRWYCNPGTNTIPTFPGAGTFSTTTNPNNFYATQWVLGRVAILLREPDRTTNPPRITDQSGVPQNFLQEAADGGGHALAPFAGSLDASPTNNDSKSTTLNGEPQVFLRDSRYDLAGTTISDFTNILSNYPAGTNWWSPLMLPVPPPPTNSNGAFTPPPWPSRYRCDPYLIDPTTGKRQINARTMATSSPYFIPNCTQFVVEYAGDFVRQIVDPTNPQYGQVVGAYFDALPNVLRPNVDGEGAPGELDFYVTGTGTNRQRHIRWYGLPRNASGNFAPTGEWIPGQPIGGSHTNNDLTEVVPLRDVICTISGRTVATSVAPFERELLPAGSEKLTARNDYGAQPNGMLQGEYYTAAWGPNDTMRPKLIRIIMTIDEPGGRTAQGQTYEFIFKLP